MKRVAIQGTKVDPMDNKPKNKRVFDAMVDNATGEVFLDIKDKRGIIRLSLNSLLEQINQILPSDSESDMKQEAHATAQY